MTTSKGTPPAIPRDRPRTRWDKFLTAERGMFHRYAAAVVFALVSLAIAHTLEPVFGRQLTALALVSVVASAIYGGRGPALLDTAITALVIDYFYSEPLRSMLLGWESYARLFVFGSIGFVVASLVNSLREAYLELHRKHREAEAATAARENVLAVVSHDLRSPLSVILLNAGLLRNAAANVPSQAPALTAVDRITRSAELMARLIADLLDAAKMESGQFQVEPRANDLLPIIEDAAESVRSVASTKNIRVVTGLQTDMPRAYCDRARMTQAISNLLNNAVKFAPEGSAVRVDLRSTDGWTQIDVQDDGPGIPPEHLPHLFTRGWQAKETAQHGLGLGLYITRHVVEAHGGRISVQSEKGHGTTFSIRIPGAPRPPSDETTGPTRQIH